jgi:4-carboxymuconolactone decarboxylase
MKIVYSLMFLLTCFQMYHGASAQSKMIHIAITNYKGEENVVWLQPVSDIEYNEANKY